MENQKYIFSDNIINKLNSIFSYSRIPHAIIIDGGKKEERDNLSKYLSLFAVCKDKNPPCFSCKNCKKAEEDIHPDITVVSGDKKKSDRYTAEIMREIQKDSVIKPNEANIKVYIFDDCQNKMSEISQNIFLKTLEEPPQNILFILKTENVKALLPTIISRCTRISFPEETKVDEESLLLANEMAKGILDLYEYSLLKTLSGIKDREVFKNSLAVFKDILRDSLVLQYGGTPKTESSYSEKLSKKLTKIKILNIMDLCDDIIKKLNYNGNINLLTTYISGELRRLSWQK